jgi:CMP-N-acetylneuraminic acid synthetase
MNYKKNLIVIIPALEENRYSKIGDLERFGGTSLLEWKVSQARDIKKYNKLFVATPSKKITKICKNLGIKTLLRKKNESLDLFHKNISLKFKGKLLMFLNPTSPFISQNLLNNILTKFSKLDKKYDSLCTVLENNQYFFYNKKSINFDFNEKSISRAKLKPVHNLTNGVHLIRSDVCNEKNNIIGNKPFFYKVNWLNSLEIQNFRDIKAMSFLIKYYFETV